MHLERMRMRRLSIARQNILRKVETDRQGEAVDLQNSGRSSCHPYDHNHPPTPANPCKGPVLPSGPLRCTLRILCHIFRIVVKIKLIGIFLLE